MVPQNLFPPPPPPPPQTQENTGLAYSLTDSLLAVVMVTGSE